MDLMIALVIGLVILCKVGAESHRGRVYAKHDNMAAQEVNSFFSRYGASEDELDEIRSQVWNRAPEVEKLRERLIKVIGREPTEPMLVFGLLAKKGKVPHLKGDNFYNKDNALAVTQDWNWSEWQGSGDKLTKQLEEARLKFLIWYDKELEKAGVHERLMWIMPSPGVRNTYKFVYRPRDAKPISECPNLELGIVTWMPMAHYFCAYLPEYEEDTFRYDPAWRL